MRFKQGMNLDDLNFDMENYSTLVDVKLLLKRILDSYWNKLLFKFCITVRHFHARVQSSTCATYEKCNSGRANSERVFRKGRYAPRFRKVRKTSEKEKWRNLFSLASNVKARGREIAGKIQNISEIANYINHETRVYLVNRKVSTSLFEILYVFLTLVHFITF